MMIMPREDTPLLLVVSSSSSQEIPTSPQHAEHDEHVHHRRHRRLFRQDRSKTLRFTLTRLCSNLSNTVVVVMAMVCVVAVPILYLRGASVEVATPMMKGQMWRGGVSSNSNRMIKSSSSPPASDPILTIDEQFLQWDEWKHDITKALIRKQQKTSADLLLNDDSTSSITTTPDTTTSSSATDDLQLQDASQEQNWNANDTTSTTKSSTTTPTAFDKWWSNATELEREWWHKTSDVLRDWEHALTDHSKDIWNETEQATKHATAKLRNKTTTTTKKATTTSSTKTAATAATAWLSPLPNLESAFTDDEEDSYDTLLYMNSSKAYSLLFYNDNTLHSHHYFSYQQGWDAQINQAYCGVASAAALLNSLPGVAHNPKILPIDPVYAPYPYATQTSILLPSLVQGDCVNQHVIRSNTSFSGILAAPFGLGMYQVQALLQCYLSSNSVQIHHVIPSVTSDPTSTSSLAAEQRWIDGIRRVLVHALLSPQTRVLINYNRAAAGQVGGGHWSPLASYHAGRDAFLLMDVAKYKYPAVWIPTSTLVAGMATVDGCSTWNFPAAQDALPLDWLHPTSMDQYAQSMTRVACQAKYRGFIIVNMTSTTSTS